MLTTEYFFRQLGPAPTPSKSMITLMRIHERRKEDMKKHRKDVLAAIKAGHKTKIKIGEYTGHSEKSIRRALDWAKSQGLISTKRINRFGELEFTLIGNING